MSDGYTPVGTVDAVVTTVSSSGLAGSRTYLFRVLAQNADGVIGYSAEAAATTGQVAPALQGIVTTNTSVSLTWTNIPGETGYVLERKRGNGAFSPITTPATGVPVYVAGKSIDSKLLKVFLLPDDDDHHMPPRVKRN